MGISQLWKVLGKFPIEKSPKTLTQFTSICCSSFFFTTNFMLFLLLLELFAADGWLFDFFFLSRKYAVAVISRVNSLIPIQFVFSHVWFKRMSYECKPGWKLHRHDAQTYVNGVRSLYLLLLLLRVVFCPWIFFRTQIFTGRIRITEPHHRQRVLQSQSTDADAACICRHAETVKRTHNTHNAIGGATKQFRFSTISHMHWNSIRPILDCFAGQQRPGHPHAIPHNGSEQKKGNRNENKYEPFVFTLDATWCLLDEWRRGRETVEKFSPWKSF